MGTHEQLDRSVPCPRCEAPMQCSSCRHFLVATDLVSARPQLQGVEPEYNLREVSQILGLSRRTLTRIIRDGRLRAFKTTSGRTGNWHVRKSDLEAYRRGRPTVGPEDESVASVAITPATARRAIRALGTGVAADSIRRALRDAGHSDPYTEESES